MCVYLRAVYKALVPIVSQGNKPFFVALCASELILGLCQWKQSRDMGSRKKDEEKKDVF